MPVDYANSVNLKFGALNLRGMTFVTGSGDWGVGCEDNSHCNVFSSDFPSSSPYVTSLGATTFPGGVGPERAVGFSSGGFSFYFGQPAFQKTAVSGYLAQPTKCGNSQQFYPPPSSYSPCSLLEGPPLSGTTLPAADSLIWPLLEQIS